MHEPYDLYQNLEGSLVEYNWPGASSSHATQIYQTSSIFLVILSFLEWLIVAKNDAVVLLVEQDAFGAEQEYIQMATELIIKHFNPNYITFSISTAPTLVNI